MGMSPYGYIIFGVPLKEEANPFYKDWEEREQDEETRGEPIYDLADYLLKREGIEAPYDKGEYPFEIPAELRNDYSQLGAWIAKNQPEWLAADKAYDARKKELEGPHPIIIEDFGSEDFHEFVIGIPGTYQRGPEWSMEPIEGRVLELLKISFTHGFTEEILKARTFCEKYGLPEFKDPYWMIGAEYG